MSMIPIQVVVSTDPTWDGLMNDVSDASRWLRNSVSEYLAGTCEKEALARVLKDYDAAQEALADFIY